MSLLPFFKSFIINNENINNHKYIKSFNFIYIWKEWKREREREREFDGLLNDKQNPPHEKKKRYKQNLERST